MRYPIKRYYGRGDLHFVTFSCYHRLPLLGAIEARDTFVNILDEVRCRHTFALIGYVVMPEHVHLVVSEPPEKTPSKVLQVLKQEVARVLLQGTRSQHFWQKRFYDFNLWSEEKLFEKLDYIHANPVNRGLVSHPGDWSWSSWEHYAMGAEGKIRIDSVWKTPVSSTNYAPERDELKSQRPHP